MIAFGVVAIYMGVDGRSTVQDNLANEFIVGSDDMTPEVINEEIPGIVKAQQDIAAARQEAGVEPIAFTPVEAPDCTVAGEEIDNGTDARCFAEYLRIHALGSTSGLTYSQMGSWPSRTHRPPRPTSPAARATRRSPSSPRKAVSRSPTERATCG